MDRERQLRRYALALSLVADPDVAGDLFMDARDEADLRRRAARWREARGEGPAQPAVTLPPLTDDQAEHALHLARRAALRRRSRLIIGVAGAALAVLAAGGALLLGPPAAPTRVKPAPAPLSQTVESEGLHLTAYQVEVTPGTVTVTWGARWDGSDQPVWRPVLVVGSPQPQRVRPVDTDFLSTIHGQVKARSLFRAVAQPGDVIWLVLETPDDRDIVLSGLAATGSGAIASSETLPVGQHLSIGPDREVFIETVTLTSDYTEVRYALPDALAGAGWPHAEVEFAIQAGGLTLRSYGVRDLSPNGASEPERTEFFPPLVDGRLRRNGRVDGFPTDARPVTLTLVESSGDEPQPRGFIEVPVPDGSSR